MLDQSPKASSNEVISSVIVAEKQIAANQTAILGSVWNLSQISFLLRVEPPQNALFYESK